MIKYIVVAMLAMGLFFMPDRVVATVEAPFDQRLKFFTVSTTQPVELVASRVEMVVRLLSVENFDPALQISQPYTVQPYTVHLNLANPNTGTNIDFAIKNGEEPRPLFEFEGFEITHVSALTAKQVYITLFTENTGIAPRSLGPSSHAIGTSVKDGDGTVYQIAKNNNGILVRRPYTSAGAFLSYGFNSFSNVINANAGDLELPVGDFIPPQDGSLMCSDRLPDKGTCYLIVRAKKAGFTSADVFTGLGFRFTNTMSGDVSWMESDDLINDPNEPHRSGVLINSNGTIQLVAASGLVGIPSLASFNSWGYSFRSVVPANAADKRRVQIGVLPARQPGELVPLQLSTQ
jgi:hypothetical protein